METLSKKIQCKKTLALIGSSLQAGYIELGGNAQRELKGTPQGSVLSPLLCNIFMHDLDVYMEGIKVFYDKGTKRRQNPAYTKVLNQIAKVELDRKLKMRKLLRQVPLGDPIDYGFVRIRYVRYADDFLISVIGPRQIAVEIQNKVSTFLKEHLGLELNKAKTLITKASEDKASFLGAEIQWKKPELKKVVLTKANKKTRITARIALLAPMKKLIKRLITRKFAKWGPDGRTLMPTGLKRIQNWSHADILAYYNAVVRGIVNYYSFADNRSSLGSVVRTLHISCARTLALKYKLRFISKAYKTFGPLLMCPETQYKLFKPRTTQKYTHPSGTNYV
jgi:hypothetical protein